MRGSWNYLGYLGQYGHFDVIGWLVPGSAIYSVYEYLASIVRPVKILR